MIEKALVELLKTDAAITTVVAGRVFPQKAAQGQPRPYIVYQLIDLPEWWDLSGPTGLASPRIQVECWADGYGEAKALAAAVVAVLVPFRGTVAGQRIQTIRKVDERDGFALIEGTDTGPSSVIQDYAVRFVSEEA